jgi:hypothetical protein
VDSLTYVYCLVRSARRPVLRGDTGGMPGGGRVRVLPADTGTWLIVSTVPASEYGEAAIERGLQNLDWVGRLALAHEAVIERFLAAQAVLPMQLFTMFMSDARAVEYITGNRARVAKILKRVERKVEWGVRLTWDEQGAREAVERRHAAPAARRRKTASGTDYLARKRDLLDVGKTQLAAARAAADTLYRALARAASGAVRRSATEQAAPGSRLLLDAAFLVPSRGTPTFKAAVKKQGALLKRSGLTVSLTGPWPPYNFIGAREGVA